MWDVLATICLLSDPGTCADRVVQIGAAECEAARSAAAARLAEWRTAHKVDDVRCAKQSGDPLDVVEVAPGLFVHVGSVAEPGPENVGDVANLAIIVGDDRVAVFDAGGSREIGESVVATVRSVTDLPISFVILSHMHPDHVFGATALADAGAEIVGHPSLPQALATRAESYETAFKRLIGPAFLGTQTPSPDRLIEGEFDLDLGGRVLRLSASPTAHSPTDVTAYDTLTGTLLGGDLVFDVHAPALDGSLIGWQAVLDRMDALKATRVVPGHGAASLPWPEGGADLRRYLDVLERDTREALEAGLTLSAAAETVAQSEAENWRLFELYNPRNATAAYTELEWE